MSAFVKNTLTKFTLKLSRHSYVYMRNSATSTNQENAIVTYDDDDDGFLNKESEIEKIRNKSRLRPEHHNLLFNKRPYPEPIITAHHTVKYNRKLYGKYGSESCVNPGIMWPTKADLQERKEYEKVAYPLTIEEMVTAAKNEIERKETEKQKIQERVIANMAKLEMWKQQLKDTIAKKEAAALAAKEKKEKLIEEVRRHFGFTVDPRDERFKEMLTIKEKEQKKKEKQARMEEREKKAIAKLMEKHKSDIDNEKSSDI